MKESKNQEIKDSNFDDIIRSLLKVPPKHKTKKKATKKRKPKKGKEDDQS